MSRKETIEPSDSIRVSGPCFLSEEELDRNPQPHPYTSREGYHHNTADAPNHLPGGQRAQFQSIGQVDPVEEKNVKKGDLQIDIQMGWIPRVAVKGPLPIRFESEEHYEAKSSLVYLGYRPNNSF